MPLMFIRLIKWTLISFMLSLSLWAKGPGEYSEATDMFEFIDNASGWHTGTASIYKTALISKSPLSSSEENLLKKYAELRKREYENSDFNAHKISTADAFGPVPFGYDHFSRAFYSSYSLREALLKLKKEGVSDENVQFLNELFQTFYPKIQAYLKESTQFSVKLIDFNKQWKATGRERAHKLFSSFVLGKESKDFKLTMLPVWSPSDILPTVDIRGPYLIMRYNPLTQTENWDYNDVIKKSVLAVLGGQNLTQRENLSKMFKLKCNGREFEFQESLQIVFGSMLPQFVKEKRKFNLYDRWSSRTYINVYAKLLFPLMEEHVKNKGTFPGFFMEQSSFLCYELHQLAIRP